MKSSPVSIQRFSQNPLLTPSSIPPSLPEMEVLCLLNPGVFEFQGKTWLLVRVAERPIQTPRRVSFPVMENGKIKILDFSKEDPDLDTQDPREFKYKGEGYLSSLSHLRLMSSDDGIHFKISDLPPIVGLGDHESFGIEDARVSTMKDGRFVITYSAVSGYGYGVGLRVTRDWKTFENYGMVISPANKDGAVFEEKIEGDYWMLNRPSGVIVGGHYIWISRSPDLRFWGDHRCIARTRQGMWDSARVGAGAAPIKTEKGWLILYHGADETKRYCLGAMLLDLQDPTRVIARSREPVMQPEMDYEKKGFFGNVVFTNGHIVRGDTIEMYYGASDTVICAATLSITELLFSLIRDF